MCESRKAVLSFPSLPLPPPPSPLSILKNKPFILVPLFTRIELLFRPECDHVQTKFRAVRSNATYFLTITTLLHETAPDDHRAVGGVG